MITLWPLASTAPVSWTAIWPVSAATAASPGTQEGGNGGEVGLGATYQEVYCGAGAAEPVPDGGGSGGAVGVLSITGCGLQVGPDQRFQDTGMGAFGVVISKMIHRMLSLSYENGAHYQL